MLSTNQTFTPLLWLLKTRVVVWATAGGSFKTPVRKVHPEAILWHFPRFERCSRGKGGREAFHSL